MQFTLGFDPEWVATVRRDLATLGYGSEGKGVVVRIWVRTHMPSLKPTEDIQRVAADHEHKAELQVGM